MKQEVIQFPQRKTRSQTKKLLDSPIKPAKTTQTRTPRRKLIDGLIRTPHTEIQTAPTTPSSKPRRVTKAATTPRRRPPPLETPTRSSQKKLLFGDSTNVPQTEDTEEVLARPLEASRPLIHFLRPAQVGTEPAAALSKSPVKRRPPPESNQSASPVKQIPSSPLKSPTKAKEVLAPITNGVIRTPSKSAPASPLKKVPATPTSIRTPPSTPVKSTPPQNGALTPMAIRRAQLKLLKQDLSGFQAIKQALHTTFPDTLWERDNQFSVLRHFLESNLGGSNPGPASMYISGPPGTGKTVTLLHALTAAKEKLQKKFREVYVNCMSVHQPQAIFTKIAEELDCKVPGNKDQSLAIEMALTSSSVPMTLVVLDEMDHLLDSKHQEVLYRIFEWPRMERSRLVLVGVANALDFADRFLPRLRTLGCAPRQLTFPPYTRLQIASILQNRLMQASKEGECPQIKPEAVTLCARKVGASTGDLRKALEVVRRAVELVETESRGQLVLQPSPSPRVVGLPQVQRVLCKVDSSAADMAPQLPLHHRLLLATILRLHKTSPQMAFGKLADTYATVCSKFQVDCTQSDCLSICHMLESQGFIRVKSHKEVRLSKISLHIDERELEKELKDKKLMAEILTDKSLSN